MASHAEGVHLRALQKPRVNLSIRTASRCSTADIEEPPVGNKRWFGVTNLSQPLSCSLGLTAQALELPSRPADQVGIDTQQRRSQLLSIEMAEVVDPAFDKGLYFAARFSRDLSL